MVLGSERQESAYLLPTAFASYYLRCPRVYRAVRRCRACRAARHWPYRTLRRRRLPRMCVTGVTYMFSD